MKLNLLTHSRQETLELGVKLGKLLHPNSVLAFYGDLAAGKTALIKGIASQIPGIDENQVCSPTFTYLNIYQGDTLALYHFDLYRFKNAENFFQMGFDEYLHAGGICCIEWAERISSYLPEKRIDVHVQMQSDGTRKFTIESFYEEVCF